MTLQAGIARLSKATYHGVERRNLGLEAKLKMVADQCQISSRYFGNVGAESTVSQFAVTLGLWSQTYIEGQRVRAVTSLFHSMKKPATTKSRATTK